MSNGEQMMINEIYGEIDDRADNSFSKEELFMHLRDTQMTPSRLIDVEDVEAFTNEDH